MGETFVLVHGAWHGGWCWRAVMSALERDGHRAFALDLPGHYDNQRDHAEVTLTSYVEYVAHYISERDLRDVVLVGHSLGGLTISGVAELVPDRLKRVIFASAMVMIDGERPGAELERVAPGRPGSRGDKTGPFSVLVKPEDFRLLAGEAELGDYQFGTGGGHHLFCRTCGAATFGRGAVDATGSEYVSIAAACLDNANPALTPKRVASACYR